jgi:transcriptional regulator with GAF, ATPase, and Fis domain
MDMLSEGIRTLLKTAAGVLPATGFGVVRKDGPEHVVVTYADAFGATAYRASARDIPEPFWPGAAGPRRVTAADLEANPLGLVESRLLHTTLSADIKRQHGVQQVLTRPVAGSDESATMVVGLVDPNPRSAAEMAELDSLAASVLHFLGPEESLAREIDCLRRLHSVETLLPALFRALDVREIFDRLSATSRDVLRHDFASLGVLSDDLQLIDLYVQTSPSSYPQGRDRMPFPPVQTAAWLYRIVDDLTTHPLEGGQESVRAGGRASLRVAIRLEDAVLGALNFTSREPTPYTATDLVVARRIAEYVGLALSHQRLAEQARRHEELRARATNLELLDGLLTSLIDTGDLRTVFERICAIAQKVLPHDAAWLPILLPDGTHARIHASVGLGQRPDIVDVPEALVRNPEWEHEIVERLSTRTEAHHVRIAGMGFESLLRVPVKLEGRFAGTLLFASKTPAAFTPPDILVARRIADRLALLVARDREVEATRRADEASARAARLESRVRALTEELDARTGVRRVIGDSAEWRSVLTQATQVAPNETTVLLLGESGTGKEVVARFVHRASPRGNGPFIALNCAALPEQLLEAELFGYERGAYTGAVQSKPGQLEQAAGGTLFLDEVGEMSLPAQAKFLRVVQEREFQRLGGTRVLRTDARIIAATNRDLERAIAQNLFREDLYYRLNVFAIYLPALRERRLDILLLSEAFVAEIGRSIARPAAGISREARNRLLDYHWPGNVRELRNIIERASILCDGGLITPEHLAIGPGARPPATTTIRDPAGARHSPDVVPKRSSPSSSGDLKSLERDMIEQALQRVRFNKSKAAKDLGLTRQQLYLRMKKYGLE